jgi:hypothetical protein
VGGEVMEEDRAGAGTSGIEEVDLLRRRKARFGVFVLLYLLGSDQGQQV